MPKLNYKELWNYNDFLIFWLLYIPMSFNKLFNSCYISLFRSSMCQTGDFLDTIYSGALIRPLKLTF